MHLQLIGKLARVAALAVPLAACMPPAEPQYANNPVFARRVPPAGRLTYLDTIKYIDDGMRYVDPTAAFFCLARRQDVLSRCIERRANQLGIFL